MSQSNPRSQQQNVPFQYWNQMSPEDKEEYVKLREKFYRFQGTPSKDRRVISFQHELGLILNFIESRPNNREIRSICCGAAFGGCYICVNTRQLKNFMGRCKSSINGSFHQLGYIGLKTKSKAKQCLSNLLSTLVNDPNLFRQWTVRCTGNDAMSCFVSSFPVSMLPQIQAEDLYDAPHSNSEKENYVNESTNYVNNVSSFSTYTSQTIEPPSLYHNSKAVQFGLPNEYPSELDPYSYSYLCPNPMLDSTPDSFLPVTELTDPNWNTSFMDMPSFSNKILKRSQSGNFSQSQFMGDFSLF